MAKHIHIHLGRPAKARDAKQHYNEGSMAATKGVKYDANPYVRGSQEHLDWSKGHNDLRAKRAKDTDYSKWYNAELAQELRWDVKTYPKGMKVKARRGDKSGNWIVDFPDGTRNGMREAELKFNEPVKDSTEGSLFHAGQIASAIRLIEAKKDLSQPEKQMLIAVVKRMSLSEVSKHLQALKSGKSKDAEGYNARLAKQLPKRVENLIAKIDSLNQLKTKLTSVLRDANALAAKVDKLTDQELSKEFEKIDMGSITGAEKVL